MQGGLGTKQAKLAIMHLMQIINRGYRGPAICRRPDQQLHFHSHVGVLSWIDVPRPRLWASCI